MKDKLEPNMYVRTKDGYIARLNKINKTDRYTEYEFDNKIGYDDDGFFHSIIEYCIDDIEIIKASHNIIDLIEVGDYVNGYLVLNVLDFNDNTRILSLERIYDNKITEEDIKSIVTKEQFENMEYRIGE